MNAKTVNAALLMLVISLSAVSADAIPPSYYLSKGAINLSAGDEGAAKALFELALKQAPDNSQTLYRIGEIYLQQGMADPAASYLKRARALAPDDSSIQFLLGRALLDSNDAEKAMGAFVQAERNPDLAPYTRFYLGKSLYLLGRYSEALERLEPIEAHPEGFREAAAYYVGLAHGAQRRYSDARQSFNRVTEFAPKSDFAEEAQSQIKQLDRKLRPWSLQAEVSFGYDSNVVQFGEVDEIDPALGITNTDDNLLVFNGRAGYKLLSNEVYEIEAAYGFYQSLHEHAKRFDLGGHTLSAKVRRFFDRGELGLDYDFQLWYYDRDRFARYNDIKPIITYEWSPRTSSSLRMGYRDIRRFDDDARDGYQVSAGISQRINLSGVQSLELGYDFAKLSTDGDEILGRNYDNSSHAVSANLNFPLPMKLSGAVGLGAIYTRYDHVLVNESKTRDERYLHGFAQLSKSLSDRSYIALVYRYEKNDSNVNIYDYDRHQVTLSFGVIF